MEQTSGPELVPPATPLDTVEEVPVWLELNGAPAVTWMCTPDQLDDLVVGWLHGEGYIDGVADIRRMRPCTSELGFWVEVAPEKLATVPRRPGAAPELELAQTRRLFKDLFARGERYKETGGIHAAALTDGETILFHAEDIGRHNAVDKVMGAAIQAGRDPTGLLLLVTGRISGELAYKAARARVAVVATPSIPSTIAVDIARAAGMVLVGRAVSGQPQVHRP
jgi:FdhD protein